MLLGTTTLNPVARHAVLALLLGGCAFGSSTETTVAPPEDAAPAERDAGEVDDAEAPIDTPPAIDIPAAMDVPAAIDIPAVMDVPACGAAGGQCCAGSLCREGVCAAGRCAVPMGCGSSGDPCCAGGLCLGALVCVADRCSTPVACGSSGAPCCDGARCAAGTTCAAGLCRTCGAEGQPCCGDACGAGTVCAAGSCARCGAPSQPCCGAACVAGGVCVTGRCVVDADRDGSPAGSDCDDGDATRYPGARERCNGRDDNCVGGVDEGSACGLWFLPQGASAWQSYARDAVNDADPMQRSPHAPTEPVRAAFDVESLGIAYVLTDARYHVLDLTTRAWTSSGARDALLPEAASRTLLSAYSVPASHPPPGGPSEGVVLLMSDGVLNYALDLASRNVRMLGSAAIPTWTGANAPTWSRTRLTWLDIANTEGWAAGSPASFCPAGTTTASRVGPYIALVTDAETHISDAGYCFTWISRTPRASFAPFTRGGAPPLADVGALFYRGGLWAVAR